jgi:4-hydroxy 2-oxovalerate aldolase
MSLGKEIKVLDCTLRDGGYYTNWDFERELTKKYFGYISQLPIEYVEVGYRSRLKDEYFGEFFYLPLSTLQNIKKYTSKKIAVMLNAKDCDGIDLKDLLSDVKDYVSLIRVATDPKKIEFSIRLAKEIKSLGFDVALNIMYISKIDHNHIFFDFISEINDCVDVLNLVDSYGSIYPHELKNLIKNIQNKANIPLGFHGHNNLELTLANTLESIECGVSYIDSTILGMGRGAGNLKTELLLTYLKSKQNIEVDLNVLGKLTEIFLPLQAKYKWGTNFAYMVSGAYSLPQKDVMEALEIDRYSLTGIVNQIKNNSNIELPIFSDVRRFDNCLIIGGGQSVACHFEATKEFMNKTQNLLIIHSTSKHIELFKEIDILQYFSVAGDELLKLDDTKKIDKYILEPSPRKISSNFNDSFNMYELEKIEFINSYHDSPLTIGLQAGLDIKTPNIYLAGFDGYGELKSKKELYLMQENQAIIDEFVKKKRLVSITATKYKKLEESSVYGMIV